MLLAPSLKELLVEDELVFVDGVQFTGSVIFDRFKGVGWESGRTASVLLDPCPPPEADVILVDLRFGRIRRCFLLDVEAGTPQWDRQWYAEDCRDNWRKGVRVERLTPDRKPLLKP